MCTYDTFIYIKKDSADNTIAFVGLEKNKFKNRFLFDNECKIHSL